MAVLANGQMEPSGQDLSKQDQGPQEDTPGPLPVLSLDPAVFREQLSVWFREHARKLPWRGVRDPYATWLSEIMLQQTRVATVIDRYVAFIEKFPTLAKLAEADEAEVLTLWSGLGYYRRARMLHKAARFVVRELDGILPRKAQALRTLPGIGEYTAAAVASIAFGQSIAVVDGNVERVLLRILGLPEDTTAVTRKRIHETARELVPEAPGRSRINFPGNHNQAMMELGATICLPRQPLCLHCPVLIFCRTRGEHATPKREPQKSRVVAHLLALRKRGVVTEVLLERRATEASLMPGMLELPPLPLDAIGSREPVLRLRHSITNTNFYVQIFTQGVTGSDSAIASLPIHTASDHADDSSVGSPSRKQSLLEDVLFVSEATEDPHAPSLLKEIPAAKSDLRWVATTLLHELPLTGLARKALQRLGLMRLPTVRMT